MSTSGRKKSLVAEKRSFAQAARTKARRKSGGTGSGSGGGKRPRRRTPARRRGPLGWIAALTRFLIGLVLSVIWRSAAVVALLIAGAVFYFYTQIPDMAELIDGRTKGSVTLLDRNGDVFAWRGQQFGGIVDADNLSSNLRNAVVATEDRRFYQHFGVSPRGVASAIRINMREGRGPFEGHGGSTVTQQTAKLLCLGVPFEQGGGMTEAQYEAECRRTTIWRKVKEAIYAMALETKFSKQEILTIYLNRAYMGGSARGAEAAAQRYFGVSAADLNVAQSAMLAGLLVAPTTYAPTNNLARSQARAATVLKLMDDQDFITPDQRQAALERPATLSEAAAAQAGGYFADWVMDVGPDFLTTNTTEDVVLRTTLDQRLQRAAEGAMEQIFAEKVRDGSTAQAAIVVMSADGAVRAMVGGRETKVSGAFNRAAMAKRQTGSAFKPFVYAAALDLGFSPNATVVDEPYTINVPGSGPYSPENYDRRYHGRVTLTEALKDSLNIPAVKVSEEAGREAVRRIAADFGLDSDLAAGPALALGASESTLVDMTGAYAGILNGGRAVAPYGLTELRIQGEGETLMNQENGYGERVISETAAKELVYMMSRVIQDGTGARAKLDRPAAGKTGTTSAARDAWFVGFTADYVAGVWMGYDDNTPLTGVTGGGLPAEIWRETMLRVHEGIEPKELPMIVPEPVQQQAVQEPEPEQMTDAQRQLERELQQQAEQQQQRQQRQPQQREADPVERILRGVLNDIFGR
ncbi:MAG: PBP1A family penicillin-binding protein [Celeribacter sp.]